MASNTNDITGDKIITRIPSEDYRNNFDAIFNKPKEKAEKESEEENNHGDDSAN